jgi:hypothetical protein
VSAGGQPVRGRAVLDRFDAATGYTKENTRLIHADAMTAVRMVFQLMYAFAVI